MSIQTYSHSDISLPSLLSHLRGQPIASHVLGLLLAPTLSQPHPAAASWDSIIPRLGKNTKVWAFGAVPNSILVKPPPGISLALEDDWALLVLTPPSYDFAFPASGTAKAHLYIHSESSSSPLVPQAVQLIRYTYEAGHRILCPALETRWGEQIEREELLEKPSMGGACRKVLWEGEPPSTGTDLRTEIEWQMDLMREGELPELLAHNHLPHPPTRFIPLLHLSPCLRPPPTTAAPNPLPVAWSLTSDDLSLCALHTLPDHRSKGLGRCVIRRAVELLRAEGVDWVHADYFERNAASRAVFEKEGWKDVGRIGWWRGVL